MFPDKVTTIRVERLNYSSPLTLEQLNHISETDLDNFDFDYYVIADNGLDKLEAEVKKILVEINKS
jgi:TFIIF-interacting CTD phosphatase-like protein